MRAALLSIRNPKSALPLRRYQVMSTNGSFRCVRVFTVTLAAVCAALLLAATAQMQAKKPITRQGLVNAVKINGLTTQELVAQIERRGVDFEMTSDAEQELRSVGARPEIIDAARANYPPATTAVARPTPVRPANNNPSYANVPDGLPLS